MMRKLSRMLMKKFDMHEKEKEDTLHRKIISTRLLLSRHLPTNVRKIEFIISTTSRISEK